MIWVGIATAAALGVACFVFIVRAELRLREQYPELYGHASTPAKRTSFARLLLLTFRPQWRHHPDIRVRRFAIAYRALFVLWVFVLFLPLLLIRQLG